MVTELTEKIKSSLKDAAKKLTGFKKRAFMAQVAIDYFNSSPRRAETELGWSRQAIATGLKELETGIICVDNYRARGRKKTEELLPNLEADIKSLVEMYSQADPKFQSTFAFTKISARAIREALKADDHDSEWRAVLVPLGILDVRGERLSIYFGQSAETSDFVADCLELWWQENQAIYPGLEELVIDLNGGAATRSNRTQFIKRMVEFTRKTQWQIRLIYYPQMP
jgi:hypothetical protein